MFKSIFKKINDKVKKHEMPVDELEHEIDEAMKPAGAGLVSAYEDSVKNFEVGSILKGTVVKVLGDDVLLDVGYKSEGVVPKREFRNDSEMTPGHEIEVLLESVEDDEGVIVLSKRKADRIRGWQRIIETHREDDVVTGTVMRKIKGGLLVDIGVPVFLPASQVNIRRPGDIAEYIGKEIQAKILKIDEEKRNIVISRRRLIEEEREKLKRKLLAELEVGQLRKGVVKNIADFGAFVDLGGIDGLLHITDMSWGRVGHPSEVVKIDETIEIMIIGIDREREKIALGLKQRSPSPWVGIEERYPIGSRHTGEAVNIVSYGAFVKLEEGIEGLVHISEMSWTRRVTNPADFVAIAEEIEVVVLGINPDKQEISLGMKQTEVNPWTLVEERYPPGTVIEGKVRNLTNYGAFVEIEEGIDGLLHISDMSWTKKINHPNELLQKGQTIRAVVLSVDQDKKRVALGLKQMTEDPWVRDIPSRYQLGDVVKGAVTKVTSFGVFVELEEDLEGLLHISELADHKVENPLEIVKVGEPVEVKILRVDVDDRKIGLSLRQAGGAPFGSAQDGGTGDVGMGTSPGPKADIQLPDHILQKAADADAKAADDASDTPTAGSEDADAASQESDAPEPKAEAADSASQESDAPEPKAEAADTASQEADEPEPKAEAPDNASQEADVPEPKAEAPDSASQEAEEPDQKADAVQGEGQTP